MFPLCKRTLLLAAALLLALRLNYGEKSVNGRRLLDAAMPENKRRILEVSICSEG